MSAALDRYTALLGDGNIRASNRAAGMKSALRIKVGGVGFFWREEKTEVYQLSTDVYAGLKLVLAGADAENTETAVAARSPLVFHVGPVVGFPQVSEDVVAPIPVNVVDLIDRPPPVNVQPCQTVRSVSATADLDHDIPVALILSVNASGNTARLDTSALSPSENSGCGIVIQQFAQTPRSKIRRSHAASMKGWVVRALATFPRCGGSPILAGTA